MAGNIKGITIEIGGDTTKLSAALKQPASETRQLQSYLTGVNKSLKFDTSNVDLLRSKQSLVGKEINSTKNELDLLKTAQDQFRESGGDLGSEEYAGLCTKISDTERSLKNLQGQYRSTSPELQAFGAKCGETGDKLTSAGKSMLGVTAAVGGLAAASVSVAANFESSMSQVQATMGISKDSMSELNGESVNTMDALGDLAKEMGSTTKFSAVECADALNYLALAGYDTQEIYDSLPTVLNLAAAGDVDLAAASDMVTDAMSTLGLETDDAETMVDQMAKTASSSNTSVSQLGEAMLTVGGTAKALVGGTTELSTALGILADNGIKGSEGGTQLRNIILSLTAPTSTAAKKLDALGVSVYDAEGNMRPLNETLEDFNNALATASDEERQNAIATVFNRADLKGVNALLANVTDGYAGASDALAECGVQWDKYSEKAWAANGAVEGVVSDVVYNLGVAGTSMEDLQDYLVNEYEINADDALLAIQSVSESVDGQGSRWDELSTAIDDSTGSAQKMADTQLDNFEGQLNLLQSGVAGLGLSFGELLLPYINRAVKVIRKAIGWLNGLDEGTKRVILTIALVVASIGPALIIAGKVCSSIAAIIDVVGKIDGVVGIAKNAIGGLSAAFSFLAANPIVLIIAGIVAFIAALVLLYSNCEWFRDAVNAVWDAIKTAACAVWDAIKVALQGYIDYVMWWFALYAQLWDGICQGWSNLCTAAGEIWGNICTTVTGFCQSLKDGISERWNSIKEKTSSTWDGIKSGVTEKATAMKDNAVRAFQFLRDNGPTIVEQMKSLVTSKIDGMKQAAISKVDAIRQGFVDKLTAAKDFVSGCIDTIKGFFNFSWSLPSIALPHFSISGEFSLNPISVPSIGVEWYRSAMEGTILNGATIFGALGDKLLGGGEAGAEAVVGVQNLREMIFQATDQALINALERAKISEEQSKTETFSLDYDRLAAMLAAAVKSVTVSGVVSIDGKQAGKMLAPVIDKELGTMSRRR